ncbi:MAG: HPr-rel-A system PqqD family peptide chaperone [Polyangiaceae bacterium]|nr:HPr-rel-A system PqqD family peptide chaperone [Polyangiaceae bacterium]
MLDPSRLRNLAISESGFLFDPVTGHTFNVNATGLAVIQALKAGKSESDIVAHLRDGFEQEGGEDVARDLEEFMARLREQGLVG